MIRISLTALLALFLAAAPAAAQDPTDPDAEGCKDSPLLTRMPGCSIAQCTNKEFEAVELQIAAAKDGNGQMKEFEGALQINEYICPVRLSLLQIQRNAEAALKKAGFTIVATGKGENDYHFVTAQKGPQWLEVRTQDWNDFTSYRQIALRVEEMKQDLVAEAAALEREIDQSGSVAVYGINFETGKATLQPGAERVLAEIVKLMKARPEWRFEVQGHTDGVGEPEANQALSEQRARAVVEWLSSQGIAAARLEPKGYGDTRPLASNDYDAGRAKNRRVELRKLNEE